MKYSFHLLLHRLKLLAPFCSMFPPRPVFRFLFITALFPTLFPSVLTIPFDGVYYFIDMFLFIIL